MADEGGETPGGGAKDEALKIFWSREQAEEGPVRAGLSVGSGSPPRQGFRVPHAGWLGGGLQLPEFFAVGPDGGQGWGMKSAGPGAPNSA